MPRSEASFDNCLALLNGGNGLLLMEDNMATAVLTESYLYANADRSDEWWRSSGKLPKVTRVASALTIEEGLTALGETEAPVLVLDPDEQAVGVVSRLMAIRALAGD